MLEKPKLVRKAVDFVVGVIVAISIVVSLIFIVSIPSNATDDGPANPATQSSGPLWSGILSIIVLFVIFIIINALLLKELEKRRVEKRAFKLEANVPTI
jgi:amino acid transporter